MKRLTLALTLGLAAACSKDNKESPTIAVFTAAPGTIIVGQSTQLVFGGTGTLTIDQGVGDVTGKTSVTVSPTATTTYVLTASLNGSTVNSSTKVTVNPLPPVATTGLLLVRSGAADPVAGAPASFDLTALGPSGTPNADYRGTVQFSSDDGQTVLPASVTFTAADAGRKTVSATFKHSGTHSLVGIDTATSSLQGTALVSV